MSIEEGANAELKKRSAQFSLSFNGAIDAFTATLEVSFYVYKYLSPPAIALKGRNVWERNNLGI